MAFLTGARTACLAVAGAALLLFCVPARAQQDADGADAIKAAFLFNFTKFVDWPPEAFDGPTAAFRVCVFAGDAFVRHVDATLREENVRGRPIHLEAAAGGDAAKRCHIAYFDQARSEHALRVLSMLRQAPVLTVGHGDAFLDGGGSIAFVLENNRIRFDVNMRAVEGARLSVSSKLLRVARHVERGDR